MGKRSCLALLLAAGAAIVACGWNGDVPSQVDPADVSEPPHASEAGAAGNAKPSSSSTESKPLWRCDEFTPRYVGNGLTVAMPEAAIFTSGGSTTDPGPIHAGTSAEFTLGSLVAVVGRRIGSDVVPEQGFGQRVENGVVLFVKAADPELRSCLLDSVHYDIVRDQQDE